MIKFVFGKMCQPSYEKIAIKIYNKISLDIQADRLTALNIYFHRVQDLSLN